MKLKLITLTAISALTLASSVLANDPAEADKDRSGGRGGRHGSPLDRMTEELNLTPEQKVKVQPIMDQMKPQLENIHREAMEKAKAVMDNAKTQIRPLLTPEQQTKLDAMKNDRGGKREGRGGRHGHRGQDGQDDSGDQ